MASDYLLNWTDDSLKDPFILAADTLDFTTTSLSLTGQGYINWGEKVLEDLIRLMENFASASSSPFGPTTGQLWFSNQTTKLALYYTGAWHELANREIFSSTPPLGTHYAGDLWYDTFNNILKVYTTANTWVTVCSQC